MTLKLLQLNMNGDNFWHQLLPFLTQHDFDVIQLQEVTGLQTEVGNIHSQIDCFQELQKILGGMYQGELAISDRLTSNPTTSYFGNATFYKKSLQKVSAKEIVLYKNTSPFPSDAVTFEKFGRVALHITFSLEGKLISFVNTHLAWGQTPEEQPYQREQNAVFVRYLTTLVNPFVISGDFNLTPQQPTILQINNLANNLTTQNSVMNTLNPRTHRAKHLFPPGFPVDYIFTSRDLTVQNFEVIQADISDHFGLSAEVILN